MLDEVFFRKLAQLSYSKFESLPKTGKPNAKEWTVMSSIIKENQGALEVVSLATGSKCIGANSMSVNGDILNDSHAEVLCRRAFIKYLYRELNNAQIFTKTKNLKFKLNENIRFHFFTTHAPCGDAAIFPKNIANNDFNDEQPHVKKIKLDICRTGAKCLEDDDKCDPLETGLNYHTVGAVRTKPGRGDPTVSVSCSDKIAKWIHLGLQGSLLSNLIDEPIYLTSFVIAGGTLFNMQAFNRAVFDRFPEIKLSPSYNSSTKLRVFQTNIPFMHNKDELKQPCPSSIIYLYNEKTQVAVNGKRQGVTKKYRNTAVGRLSVCKLELFNEFVKLCPSYVDKTYAEAKSGATEYLANWTLFKKNAFKIWPAKNKELLQFKIK